MKDKQMSTVDLAVKFTGLAAGFSDREYSDPKGYFGHRLAILKNWGRGMESGDRVLHVGCGDGYLTRMLLDSGYRVDAFDCSPGMLARVGELCLKHLPQTLTLTEGDINDASSFPAGEVDHVFAVMRGFFTYSRNPVETMTFFRKIARKKVIADFDPRKNSPEQVKRLMHDAGFKNVQVRAFLVPQKRKLPALVQSLLTSVETTPLIYNFLVRRKFHLWVVGEK